MRVYIHVYKMDIEKPV